MLSSMPRLAQSTLTLALLLFCQATFAVVGTPVLVPPHPVAGQLVQVSVYSGGCDAFSAYPSPTVTRAGDKIRIDLSGVFTIDPFCVFPSGDSLFPVGTFEPGRYSLQVDRTYIGLSGRMTETLAVIPFGVAAVATIPALNTAGIVLLILSLLAISGVRMRRRHCALESTDRF